MAENIENKMTILLADDDESLREIYTQALSQDFEVLVATNGKEAVDLVKKNHKKISVALLDVIMPEMDGFDVVRFIKKSWRFKKIPVIVLTSLSDFDDRKEALEQGADRFFVKTDNTPAQLVKEVKELIAEKVQPSQ